jgi:hypothetical protein
MADWRLFLDVQRKARLKAGFSSESWEISEAGLRLRKTAENGCNQATDVEVVLCFGHARVDGIGAIRVLQVLQNLAAPIDGDDMTVRDR